MGCLYLRGKTYWIKYYHNGKPISESAKTHKKMVAKKLLERREGEISSGKMPGYLFEKVTFTELYDDLEADYEYKGQDTSRIKGARKKHIEPFFGHLKSPGITTDKIKIYINKRKKEDASNATINRELSAIKRMLRLGSQITPPKVDRVPYIPMLDEDNVKKGFFEHEDFLSLREALPSHLKNFVTFAYKTGWRFSEINNLTWKQVDRKNNVVRLEVGTTKNKAGRVIYLDEELQGIIHRQFINQQVGCRYVFHREGHKIKDCRVAWNTACRETGLGYGYKLKDNYAQKWERKFKPGPTLHDFRRSAVRNMIRAGIPEVVAMKISGHKTRSVFDRYNIVDTNDLQKAAEQQEKYLAQK
jgi:integrase